ncbi:MAG: hypothetical protein ACU0BE_10570, partial [Paracoccus sp. (in: a-proteobacteria)]
APGPFPSPAWRHCFLVTSAESVQEFADGTGTRDVETNVTISSLCESVVYLQLGGGSRLYSVEFRDGLAPAQ